MRGPTVATIEVRRIPLTDNYAFDVDPPLDEGNVQSNTIADGLRLVGELLDERMVTGA